MFVEDEDEDEDEDEAERRGGATSLSLRSHFQSANIWLKGPRRKRMAAMAMSEVVSSVEAWY